MKLFIFGSTGDLVQRKVLPALQALNNKNLEIYAMGRRNIKTPEYLEKVCSNGRCNLEFMNRIKYIKINFEEEDICEKGCPTYLDRDEVNHIYISLPPKLIEQTLNSIITLKEQGFKFKILIEKPFGEDLDNAKSLQEVLKKNNLEKDIFLSDHYLFKENIIDLEKQNFKNLEIVSLETVGLESRAGYYESVGALRDMVQSHFFNILFKLIDPKETEDLEVLEFKRGQYKDYKKDLGKESTTETFVDLKFKIKDKTIRFKTGKAMAEKDGHISIDDKILRIKSGDEYKILFDKFLEDENKLFPTQGNSILAWELINKIEEKEEKLEYY